MRPCQHQPIQPDTCRVCWLYENKSEYRQLWDKGPGLLEKAVGFAGAVVKHTIHGMPHVSDEQFEQRMAICGPCEQRLDDSCRLCGCNLKLKARWVSQDCPLKKWAPGGV